MTPPLAPGPACPWLGVVPRQKVTATHVAIKLRRPANKTEGSGVVRRGDMMRFCAVGEIPVLTRPVSVLFQPSPIGILRPHAMAPCTTNDRSEDARSPCRPFSVNAGDPRIF